jgi:hypothetical protein
MRDQLVLAVCALAVAGVAWAFWHFLGTDAVTVMLLLALVGVTGDNARLRRRLGKRE